ncbi:patatin-like phospholipase family protein [Teredinibacter haidensis]|uniref:patatin-like phospholipase family protein n=1 Tax=Teredinibacter haidensis TaxID=2731755 RepID=UPI0009491534|nr:patatin-like phospholipase family protein [Teredinibacter haidensis]
MSTNALILSGGGARASYQVGVLTALADILPNLHNPFPIICGTSAGAINATALAAHPGEFRQSAYDLANTWKYLEIENVFKSGWWPLILSALKIGSSLFNEGVGRKQPLALLDNSPLRDFLTDIIPFDNIAHNIAKGRLEALCITALGYSTGESVSFFQGNPALGGWRRYRRVGTPREITVDHLLASSAIPTVFPTVPLDREYFGDGAMRQIAPISPALHLGADRVFVIGVSGNRNPAHWGEGGHKYKPRPKHSPSMAQIVGQMFNSAFIDALEGDIEQLERVNQLLSLLDDKRCDKTDQLRPVDTLIISPSKALDKIAGRRVRNMPSSLRFFLRTTGATARGGGSAAASYLLFSHEYCNELMELGYQDAMWERQAIEDFFERGDKQDALSE